MTVDDQSKYAFWSCVAQMGYTTIVEFVFDVISTNTVAKHTLTDLQPDIGYDTEISRIMQGMDGVYLNAVKNVFNDEHGDYIGALICDAFQEICDLLVDYGHPDPTEIMDDTMLVLRHLLELMRSYTHTHPSQPYTPVCVLLDQKHSRLILVSGYKQGLYS